MVIRSRRPAVSYLSLADSGQSFCYRMLVTQLENTMTGLIIALVVLPPYLYVTNATALARTEPTRAVEVFRPYNDSSRAEARALVRTLGRLEETRREHGLIRSDRFAFGVNALLIESGGYALPPQGVLFSAGDNGPTPVMPVTMRMEFKTATDAVVTRCTILFVYMYDNEGKGWRLMDIEVLTDH